ncbi:MAG: RNA polymerase sigma factor [Desulfobacteraceae bacterium]|nr:RNA polymerase sigma factor [Desulfobacteraceae bacterium]MBC2752063.1 RNA polymerase sigma factor [Desulfobacteraceae bacterium]
MPWPRLKTGTHRETVLRKQLVALLPRLRRFARNLTGDTDSADDLVQATCERSLARFSQFHDGTRFDSWLYRMIYTQWIDRMRRRQRQSARDESLRNLQDITGEGVSSPRRMVSFMDVKKALGHLSEDSRAAIVLVAVEGYTYAEAATVLGVPAGTVASRVARARGILAERFRDDHPRRLRVHKVAGRRLK